ncbi:polymorphic toxin type 37 domain-containing protein [Nocardia sp. SC052]
MTAGRPDLSGRGYGWEHDDGNVRVPTGRAVLHTAARIGM